LGVFHFHIILESNDIMTLKLPGISILVLSVFTSGCFIDNSRKNLDANLFEYKRIDYRADSNRLFSSLLQWQGMKQEVVLYTDGRLVTEHETGPLVY